jgi:hypothetical protein
VGDAVGEDPGLAGTGAGDHQQWAALVDDRFTLVRVESGKQVVGHPGESTERV